MSLCIYRCAHFATTLLEEIASSHTSLLAMTGLGRGWRLGLDCRSVACGGWSDDEAAEFAGGAAEFGAEGAGEVGLVGEAGFGGDIGE